MSSHDDLQLNERVASIILAGGQGTRLHPLTEHRCKPSVCFGGKYRLIDIPISNSINSQIHRIFVLSQYFASDLQKHLSATYPHSYLQRGNLEMLCPEETPQGTNWFLGTADAVRKNITYLKEAPVDYFLILSGDQLYTLDLIKMIEFTQEKGADLVIASLLVPKKEATRMGLLKTSKEHKILDFIEKPKEPELLKKFCFDEEKDLYLGSMGIYVFRKEALVKLLEEEGNDFGKDLIPKKIKENESFAFIYDGYWEDIGTIDSYYQANLALASGKNCLNLYDTWNPIYTNQHSLPSPLIKDTKITTSIISQGCLIQAESISHSLIGSGTHIAEGTVIKDSIVLGSHSLSPSEQKKPVSIGRNCLIEKAILDEECSLGDNVILVNKKNLTHFDGDKVVIRDGIIIVPSKAEIPSGFVL